MNRTHRCSHVTIDQGLMPNKCIGSTCAWGLHSLHACHCCLLPQFVLTAEHLTLLEASAKAVPFLSSNISALIKPLSLLMNRVSGSYNPTVWVPNLECFQPHGLPSHSTHDSAVYVHSICIALLRSNGFKNQQCKKLLQCTLWLLVCSACVSAGAY